MNTTPSHSKRPVDIRRSNERFSSDFGWLRARPSFSFAQHYDPTNMGHGLLVVHNEDRIAPETGFPMHPHADMEIITWVLEGELEHRDTLGSIGRIIPGLAQKMSAGSGIRHSEYNASSDIELHLLQMWVLPDTPGIEPGYEQLDVTDRISAGGMFPLASGSHPDAAVRITQRGATLWVARLGQGDVAELPSAPYVHAFVARGSADLESAGGLGQGDAARLTDAGALRIFAGEEGAELVVWETV